MSFNAMLIKSGIDIFAFSGIDKNTFVLSGFESMETLSQSPTFV